MVGAYGLPLIFKLAIAFYGAVRLGLSGLLFDEFALDSQES
jgi:hypothetical protein